MRHETVIKQLNEVATKNNVKTVIYADDITFVIATTTIKKLESTLESLLNQLSDKLSSIDLEIETSKTQFLLLKGYKFSGERVHLYKLNLTEVEELKILGYTFGKRGMKDKHWVNVEQKASRIIDLISENFKMIKRIPIAWKILIVDSLIMSHIIGLLVSSLNGININKIRKIMVKLVATAIRKLFKVPASTSSITMIKTLGIELP